MNPNRIEKYYSSFIEREVGGLVISIAPMEGDIPDIKYVGEDPFDGSLNIEFEIVNENMVKTYSDEHIEIYLGSNSGKIAKIKINEAKKIQNVILIFDDSVGHFLSDWMKKTDEMTSLKEKLNRIGIFDLVERQLTESKDIFKQATSSK